VKPIASIKTVLFFGTAVLFTSCTAFKPIDPIEPHVWCGVPECMAEKLPPPFADLSQDELRTSWGKEYFIGQAFAREADYYRAITAYKRAIILIPRGSERRIELQYSIFKAYVWGRKFDLAKEAFESSDLSLLNASFCAFNELLLLLYTTYEELGDCEKADKIRCLIETQNPEMGDKLNLYEALKLGKLECIQNEPLVEPLQCFYSFEKKSPAKAQMLNAFLPGAGYAYIGQKNTAITAFLINALFIGAAYEFFKHHNVPAAVITLSFESGWYFGGIYGGGLAAKEYNERLYETNIHPFLVKNGLYPTLMFTTSF